MSSHVFFLFIIFGRLLQANKSSIFHFVPTKAGNLVDFIESAESRALGDGEAWGCSLGGSLHGLWVKKTGYPKKQPRLGCI